MRFVPLLLLVLAATRLAGAEVPPDLAELEQKIATAPAAARPALLIELADRSEAIDPARGIVAAEKARETATSPREKLAAEAVLASLRRQQTDYTGAMELARKGLDAATQLGDDRLRAKFFYVLARTYWSLADYPSSVKAFHEAIHLGEKTHDIALLCDAHTGIITNYTELHDHPQAEFHLAQAKKYAEELGDPRRLGDYYKVLGNHLDNINDHAGARAAHERSLQIHEAAGNERGVADALQNLGYVIEADGNLRGAEANYTRAIAIYERLGLRRHLANAARQLGRVLIKQKRFAEGLAQLDRSLELAREFGGGVAVANAYRQLAIAYEAAGNLPVALDYQRKLQAATDTIFSEKSRQQIAVLDARYEAERRQLQIDLLQRDQALKDEALARGRVQRYGLIALLVLGGLAVASFVSRQRLKLAAERRVFEETRLAHQSAEEANRLKTRLLGIASHDLKTPLRALVAGAGEIARDPHDAAGNAALAVRMRAEGERMFALIRDLLDVSAIESGRLELARDTCNLAALVRERIDALRSAAAAKNQMLACTAPAQAVVVGDGARLAQVLDNLIGNAIKFTPPGKAIHVAVEIAGSRAVVRVRDEGPGLLPEDFAHLFQPFQTLSAQPTGNESSSGLGLFIAREIIALHGGQLGVDSVPGAGATFAFELSLEPADNEPLSAEPVLEAPAH